MSRREDRDSHAKRLHSRSDRDLSPKRSRRDEKQATERAYSSRHHLEVDTLDRDQKQQRRPTDALPSVTPTKETKVQPEITKEGLDRKVDRVPGGTKHSSNPTEIPTSESYYQNDERVGARHGGRSLSGRAPDHGRWRDLKEHSRDGFRDKGEQKQPRADDSKIWGHDGSLELESNVPPVRKRPAFSEKKIETPAEPVTAANGSDLTRPPAVRREERSHHYPRREERGQYYRGLDNKADREERNHRRGDGSSQRGEVPRGGYQSRERFSGEGMRGRDRSYGRYNGDRSMHQPGGLQVEKWKHDLFDTANRSPSPKKEEEQIAKVEALLAQ